MSKTVLYEGPDISYHNGIVNIKQIRDSGCKRIGLRAGYGKNNTDQKWASNALACFNLGVAVLVYWFSYAYTIAMAVKEAEYAVEHVKKYWSKCPIAFDFEYDSVRYARTQGVNITKSLCTEMAIAFLKAVKAAGHIPVIYTNRDYLRNYFDMDKIMAELGTVYVWYARYNSSLPASELDIADVWQYTSSGSVPGVSGRVDMNKFYTDFDGQSVPVEKPVATMKNINTLNFQKAANVDGYRDQDGKPLVEDGIDGPKTQYVRRQIFLKARRALLGLKVGSQGEVVRWWQGRCNEILGSDIKEDGKFGKDTDGATREVQELLNLAVDGIAGYDSIQAGFYN